MIRLVLVAIALVAVIGIGAVLWINIWRAPAHDGDFFAAPQEYPTTGGQDLKPRWNASEEAADATAN